MLSMYVRYYLHKCLIVLNVFWLLSSIANLLLYTLGKGRGPSFDQTWIPFTQERMIRAMFSWNWPSGFRRVEKYETRLRTDGRTTDDQKISHAFSAQVSCMMFMKTNQTNKQTKNTNEERTEKTEVYYHSPKAKKRRQEADRWMEKKVL